MVWQPMVWESLVGKPMVWEPVVVKAACLHAEKTVVNIDPTALPPQRLGELLRQARARTNLNRGQAARRASMSVRRLAALEKGTMRADDRTIDALLTVYGIDLDQLIPPRRPIVVGDALLPQAAGTVAIPIGATASLDEVLRTYISMIVEARASGRLDSLSLRASDVQMLAAALGTDDNVTVDRIVTLLGCSREDAVWFSRRLRSFVGPIAGVALGIAVVAGSVMAGNTSGVTLQPAEGHSLESHASGPASSQGPAVSTTDMNY